MDWKPTGRGGGVEDEAGPSRKKRDYCVPAGTAGFLGVSSTGMPKGRRQVTGTMARKYPKHRGQTWTA